MKSKTPIQCLFSFATFDNTPSLDFNMVLAFMNLSYTTSCAPVYLSLHLQYCETGMDFCGSISSQRYCAFTILRPSTIRPRSRRTFNVADSSSDSAMRTATTADWHRCALLPYEHRGGHQDTGELTAGLHSGSGCCPGLAVSRARAAGR